MEGLTSLTVEIVVSKDVWISKKISGNKFWVLAWLFTKLYGSKLERVKKTPHVTTSFQSPCGIELSQTSEAWGVLVLRKETCILAPPQHKVCTIMKNVWRENCLVVSTSIFWSLFNPIPHRHGPLWPMLPKICLPCRGPVRGVSGVSIDTPRILEISRAEP